MMKPCIQSTREVVASFSTALVRNIVVRWLLKWEWRISATESMAPQISLIITYERLVQDYEGLVVTVLGQPSTASGLDAVGTFSLQPYCSEKGDFGDPTRCSALEASSRRMIDARISRRYYSLLGKVRNLKKRYNRQRADDSLLDCWTSTSLLSPCSSLFRLLSSLALLRLSHICNISNDLPPLQLSIDYDFSLYLMSLALCNGYILVYTLNLDFRFVSWDMSW
jgi:hypothetical protein